jgi:hypothetical protein
MSLEAVSLRTSNSTDKVVILEASIVMVNGDLGLTFR